MSQVCTVLPFFVHGAASLLTAPIHQLQYACTACLLIFNQRSLFVRVLILDMDATNVQEVQERIRDNVNSGDH